MGNLNNDELLMMNAIDAGREKVHMIAKTIWEFKEVGWEEFKSSNSVSYTHLGYQTGTAHGDWKNHRFVRIDALETGREGGKCVYSGKKMGKRMV